MPSSDGAAQQECPPGFSPPRIPAAPSGCAGGLSALRPAFAAASSRGFFPRLLPAAGYSAALPGVSAPSGVSGVAGITGSS